MAVQEDVRSDFISADGCGNVNKVADDECGSAVVVADVDKFILGLVLSYVLEKSSVDVINGRVDDDDWLDEEIVVGVSFSSNTDSPERFPTRTTVAMLSKKMKVVVHNVVAVD